MVYDIYIIHHIRAIKKPPEGFAPEGERMVAAAVLQHPVIFLCIVCV